MNCKKCDQTVFDLSIRSLKDIPNGLKCDQREPSPMILLYNYMGPHTFSLQPNEYLVTVTYPNSVPYRTIFSNVVYLQNESLENNLNVDAEQVVIGSNVASNRSQGPVTVENGSSAISTSDGTTIHNDFEVKMGASLEITTNTSDLF